MTYTVTLAIWFSHGEELSVAITPFEHRTERLLRMDQDQKSTFKTAALFTRFVNASEIRGKKA